MSRIEEIKRLQEKISKLQEEAGYGVNASIAGLSFQLLRKNKLVGVLDAEEQASLIDYLMEYAYVMKTGQKDRHVAKSTFEKILRLDPGNLVANYRYGFLMYEERKWILAIQHFMKVVQGKDDDNILTADQKIKAHLFIGYCAASIAQEAGKQADILMENENELEAEGISIEDLKEKMDSQLKKREFSIHSNAHHQFVSANEYHQVMDHWDREQLVLDLTTDEYFIRFKEKCRITYQQAILLKSLLIGGEEGLPLSEIFELQSNVLDMSDDKLWTNYRQKIRRLNLKLQEAGLWDKRIENIPDARSYRLLDVNYLVFDYEAR